MELVHWLIFGLTVCIGSYIQSVAGFAMGMIMIAVLGAAGVISLPVLTAVVSLVSGVNIVLALKGHTHHIDRRLLKAFVIGQVPAIVIGVCLIDVLDRDARALLELLLGLFITVGAVSLMLRRTLLSKVSPPLACFGAGIAGGLLGGLFAASGPVMGWFVYRQPLPLAVIRATLLAFFSISTVVRTVVVGAQGGLTGEVMVLTGVGLPLVLLGIWLARAFPPAVPEAQIKRSVTVLLVVLGLYIIWHALHGWSS